MTRRCLTRCPETTVSADVNHSSVAHIRQLLASHKIEGRKFSNAWMVDAESLQKYRARMERLGKRKHGLWANTSTAAALEPD